MVKVLDQVTQAVSKLGPSVNYGEPVKVGGSEVVPVSVVWMGFGGGEGPDGQGGVGGGGGGGGGASLPIGAYVDGLDGPEFQPNLIALLTASAVFVAAVGTAVGGIVAASRGRRSLFR